MNNSKNKLFKIGTHDGIWHPDDVAGIATQCLLLDQMGHSYQIFRTRNALLLDDCDILIDVGGKYNINDGHFDHHQPEGAGLHKSGVPMASFGLMWEFCGKTLCGDNNEIAFRIERKLVCHIDASDNGTPFVTNNFPDAYPYSIREVLITMFREPGDKNYDNSFLEAVSFFKNLLQKEINVATYIWNQEQKVESAYRTASDKSVIELPEGLPFQEILSGKPEPLFVFFMNEDKKWQAQAVQSKDRQMEYRKLFPLAWRGLKDGALEKASGLMGSTFCHRSGHLFFATNREAVMKATNKALSE